MTHFDTDNLGAPHTQREIGEDAPDLTEAWDHLKDNLPLDGHAAAELLFDMGDELADALTAERAKTARLVASEFDRGYVIACCNLVNLHDQPGIAWDVLAQLGTTKAAIEAMDLSEYDAKAIRKIERERGNAPPYRAALAACEVGK